MLWKGRRQSENVEDRRGGGGGGGPFGGRGGGMRLPIGRGAGGGGLSTILILVVLFFVLSACGIDPTGMLSGGGDQVPGGGGQITEQSAPASDEMKQFVSTVLAETEDVWSGIFQAEGQTYEKPKLVLFSGGIASACGYASSAAGPFYCPGDRKVYLDTAFFDAIGTAVRRGRRLRGGLCGRPRGRPPRPEHHRHSAEIQPDEAADAGGRSQPDVDARRTAGRLLRRRLGSFYGAEGHPGTGRCRGGAERRDRRSATTRCSAAPRAMSCRRASTTAPAQQRQTWFARGFKSGKLSECDTFNNPI